MVLVVKLARLGIRAAPHEAGVLCPVGSSLDAP